MKQNAILVFGGSILQHSLIENCKQQGLFTVVIDPDPNAIAASVADAFEIVSGFDFNATCRVVEKYKINAVITAATDKPLLMMARIASVYGFNFFSQQTAQISTDKLLMKDFLYRNDITCATGRSICKITDDLQFPIVLKPRDNSGSRGVVYCENKQQADHFFNEVKMHTQLDTIIAEEFIEGKEYSVESLHFADQSFVIQVTEKITGTLPYFVEMGHIQPAELDDDMKDKILELIRDIARVFLFENCASHCEIKIHKGKITVIEVSPRLGGDFITSMLVPLSTGINMEKELIRIALGQLPVIQSSLSMASGIFYFDQYSFPYQKNKSAVLIREGICGYNYQPDIAKQNGKIKSSIDRYGYVILQESDIKSLLSLKNMVFDELKQ